ncbi:hypothetical protein TI39_contig305g00012 [Zymoseptoria brevis]|uniref:Uncharacterized protein n=1 Tax=Zymoseptoria brevis TaxID=1047168 RepID=A0A0F4GUI4_9PEZI|nr:hypothetical protein TI39_contig305g00012 [Zymoseptoria brevis]
MSVTSRNHENHDGAEVAEVLLTSSDESLSPEDPQDNSDQQDAAMPSSPPQSKEGMSRPQEVMGPPKISASQARKRTRDEMAMADQHQSSSALPGAINASPLYQDEHSRVSRDTSATIRQDAPTQSTQSYHDTPLTTPCPPESRPPSGQGDNIGLKASALPSHPQQPKVTAASVSSHTASDLAESEQESDASSSTESSRPEERIQAFDWDELLIQYHEEMNKATAEEHGILKEFRELGKYFNVWAQTGCGKEVDRSFKRLKTQQAYVQNEERQLEEKRVHYVKVVDAFKSALQLLEN